MDGVLQGMRDLRSIPRSGPRDHVRIQTEHHAREVSILNPWVNPTSNGDMRIEVVGILKQLWDSLGRQQLFFVTNMVAPAIELMLVCGCTTSVTPPRSTKTKSKRAGTSST